MQENQKLQLSQVTVRPLDSTILYNQFSSGKIPIDRFLKNRAVKCAKRLEYRTFCATVGDSDQCVGYYSLQIGSDMVSQTLISEDNYLKNKAAFPAIELSYLGVTQQVQRQGLGQFLLQDAFEKVAQVSQVAGFYALTVQAIDQDVVKFYQSVGFEEYMTDQSQPKLLYPVASLLQLVNS